MEFISILIYTQVIFSSAHLEHQETLPRTRSSDSLLSGTASEDSQEDDSWDIDYDAALEAVQCERDLRIEYSHFLRYVNLRQQHALKGIQQFLPLRYACELNACAKDFNLPLYSMQIHKNFCNFQERERERFEIQERERERYEIRERECGRVEGLPILRMIGVLKAHGCGDEDIAEIVSWAETLPLIDTSENEFCKRFMELIQRRNLHPSDIYNDFRRLNRKNTKSRQS